MGYVTFGRRVTNLFWEPKSGKGVIYRSEAPHDDFKKVDEINLDINGGHYVDETKRPEGFLYYKINDELLHMFQEPNAYAKEIVRRDKWFLKSKRHSGGTSGYALIKRTDGEKCECWDEINQKATRSNCPTCYGTGMKNPYYKPLKMYFDFSPSKKVRIPSDTRVSTTSYNQQVWTTNEPLLKPGDLITFQGLRYRVISNITYSRVGEYITKQFIPLEAISRSRPEYKVPLPPDTK
ncbi:MAG: hypothetical protein ACOC4M_11430 [Promethearchaeia archaeon]